MKSWTISAHNFPRWSNLITTHAVWSNSSILENIWINTIVVSLPPSSVAFACGIGVYSYHDVYCYICVSFRSISTILWKHPFTTNSVETTTAPPKYRLAHRATLSRQGRVSPPFKMRHLESVSRVNYYSFHIVCVRPQFQWYQLAYATEMKSIQLHDSIEWFSQKIVSITLHYITLHCITYLKGTHKLVP